MPKPRKPVTCRDCQIICSEDKLCPCCIAIREDNRE